MRFPVNFKLSSVLALAGVVTAAAPSHERPAVMQGVGPTLQSIGPLAWGPKGTLYAVDYQAATIYALDVSGQAAGAVPGTGKIQALGRTIASALGTDFQHISTNFGRGLVVDPETKNTYVALMRGDAATAKPVLVRIDGAGKVTVVDFAALKYASVTLPNPVATMDGQDARAFVVTQMAFDQGKLYVAGLSNEEFASKLWTISYPFKSADKGTSIEMWHDHHSAFETKAPIFAFVPYTLDKVPYLLAGYLCTPLVKIPVASLKPGMKVDGTTIAELGAGSRPISMVAYTKEGKSYLLMSNTSIGVLKIPVDDMAKAPAITEGVGTMTAGIAAQTIDALSGAQWMGRVDATHVEILRATPEQRLDLETVELP